MAVQITLEFVATAASEVFELALAYMAMAAVLIVRPWGLFGVREA